MKTLTKLVNLTLKISIEKVANQKFSLKEKFSFFIWIWGLKEKREIKKTQIFQGDKMLFPYREMFQPASRHRSQKGGDHKFSFQF